MMSSSPTPSQNLRDFPDWYSPMLVKEMRHGLRTSSFMLTFLLLHGILGLIILGALFGVDMVDVSSVFWSAAALLLLGAMPLQAFMALASERKHGTLDMLTLTNISHRMG